MLAFVTDDLGGDGITAELEILRGDLARLLFDAAKAQGVDCRFGGSIAAIKQTAADVELSFDDGRTERFDLVVVAEGVGLTTREIVFEGEARSRWMDVLIGYFAIPAETNDSSLWLCITPSADAALPYGRARTAGRWRC